MRHLRDANNLTAHRIAEARDQVQQLRDQGYGPLLDAVAHPASLTQSGQIKVTAVARIMNASPKVVSVQLQQIRMSF